MILDPDIWQSRIWRFLTDIETNKAACRSFRVTFAFRFDTTGLSFSLGGQLRLLSLRYPKQPSLLYGQCIRFAYLLRFVPSRLYDGSLRQSFSLGGQLRLLVLGPNESGRRFFLSPTFLSRTF